MGVVVHATQKVEAGRSEVKGYPWLGFETSLDYMNPPPHLKTKIDKIDLIKMRNFCAPSSHRTQMGKKYVQCVYLTEVLCPDKVINYSSVKS